MLLSGNDEQLLTGNFMGDFVKGTLCGRFPERIRQGIVLHRSIDSFAGRNPCFLNSKRRIDPLYGLYRGVMVDLFYDHFLVSEWDEWSDQPFEGYLEWSRRAVARYNDELPERLQGILAYIFDELLPSYADPEGIGRALSRMSSRVRRANPLEGGEVELLRNYDGLRDDFRVFMPQALRFVDETMADGT